MLTSGEFFVDYVVLNGRVVRVLKNDKADEGFAYLATDVLHVISPLCYTWSRKVIKDNSISINVLKAYSVDDTPISNIRGVNRFVLYDKINTVEMFIRQHLLICKFCSPVTKPELKIENKSHESNKKELDSNDANLEGCEDYFGTEGIPSKKYKI